MIDLVKLATEYPHLTIQIKLSDLLANNRQLIQKTKDDLEKQLIAANEESYPTINEITSLLNVSKTTLWRWSKEKYLNPVEVGYKRRYKMSDIKKLLEGKE